MAGRERHRRHRVKALRRLLRWRDDGRTLHVRTATVAEPAQKAIYDALGIDPSPGGTRRTVV